MSLALIYGVASALVWGAGDFSGGLAAKKTNVFHVVFLSHIVGFFMLIGLALVFSEATPSGRDLLFGGLAGLGGMVGVLAFYRGLAIGRMGVVAPIAAVTTALIPIIIGIIQDGVPPVLQLVGFGLALMAVWLLAGSEGIAEVDWQEIVMPALAGFGFATFLVMTDQISDGKVFWPLSMARVASVTFIAIVLLFRRSVPKPAVNQLGIIALAGIFDTGGNAFFALAAQAGRLDLAAVLSSMYPAATVFLAWLVLGERLTRFQMFGVGITIASLVLIALG